MATTPINNLMHQITTQQNVMMGLNLIPLSLSSIPKWPKRLPEAPDRIGDVKDRQILDGPFILNEVIQWCKSKKKQSLIFKVDFEKAYDSVRWDFLDDVLKKFGFGNKWRDWIQKCLRSSRGSIIINGSPTEEFQFFKGLKQGDPLSPFLFILIMESLHLSFQSVVDVGLFKGIHLSPLVNLSHMFYADDAVFVGQWCDDNINTLVHVLECFFRASGLRINMSKSKIMGVNVGDDKIKVAASKLGCLILNTPFTYLGTKVGGNMSRVQAWTEIIDKVKSRLSNWKLKSLSIGGRLTLLKSVLGSIPIFHMSIFKVPLTVLRSLESIRCQFFNGHELKSNKSSWVKWNSVLAAKEKGGLGVSSLFALNRALLMKWFWRFYSHNDSLWSRVIKAIYGVDGEVNKVSKYASRSCWRDIINEVRKLKDQGINMRDFMYIKVGNGETTKFWDDIWIGSKPLKLLFPRIYALDNIKDASICMKLNEPSLDNNFRRSIRGGIEQSQFKKLTDLLIPIVLNPCPDRWFWSLEGSGEFSVASIRRFIDDQRLLTVDSKTLWIKSVPIKVNILAWKIKLEALPTRFNISRRGIEIDSILCPICDRGVESTRHIFFSCCLVRQIARKICSWWDIEYSDVNSFTEWINWMASLRLQSKVKMMIQGVFFVVWWLVWSYRNKLLFEEKKPSKAIIFDDVVSISFYWWGVAPNDLVNPKGDDVNVENSKDVIQDNEDNDSENDVEDDDTKTACFMAVKSSKDTCSSKNGGGTGKKSLYECWKDDYDDNPYDDDDEGGAARFEGIRRLDLYHIVSRVASLVLWVVSSLDLVPMMVELSEVVLVLMETELAVEAARRFPTSSSLSMLSASLAKHSSMVGGVDVGGI
ncbi:RNA-directed DNA polymerase, eukaryota, reverse transcriptase zinc-binding domain protein [Tanacetum coccineum]